MRGHFIPAAVLAAALVVAPAEAAIMIYSIAGTGAGLLDGEPWDGIFTIRLAADTSQRIGNPADPGITLLPVLPFATVELEYRSTSARLGFDTLLGQDAGDGTVALVRAQPVGKENPVLLDFRTSDPVDLLVSFGPIPGLDIWRFGDWRDVDTSAGRLSILSIEALSVSGAVRAAIPEPTTWAMLIAGFGLVGMGLRRRQRMPAG